VRSVPSADVSSPTPPAFGPGLVAFFTERQLATLTTLRADGSPHVVPVGVTFDATTGIARVIASGTSAKARHVRAGQSRVAVCQVDGRCWATLEGTAVVREDAAAVADAEARYASRYSRPRVNPARVVLEISVDRVLGNAERWRTPEQEAPA
jgi:PPOX class probable F420-dependent enzyme